MNATTTNQKWIERLVCYVSKVGTFNLDLLSEAVYSDDEAKSLPCHESVLRPLLSISSDCQVFGLKPGSEHYEIVASRLAKLRRENFRLDVKGDVIGGNERFWNAALWRRGTIVIVTPSETGQLRPILEKCSVPSVYSSLTQVKKAHPPSAIKYCSSVRDNGEIAWAISASNGIQTMDVFPPMHLQKELFLLSHSVCDRSIRQPLWIWDDEGQYKAAGNF